MQEIASSDVRSVHVALDVLEAVAFADAEIGVSEIASRLHMAKGAVHRHLQTLAKRGYLVQSVSTSRYQVGIKFQFIGRLGRMENSLYAASQAPMTKLRNAVGETVVLSAMEGAGARVMATVPGTSMVEIGVRVGTLLPLAGSAQGKVLLAFGGERSPAILKRAGDDKRSPKVDRELARARQLGWLASVGEVMPGINAFAAPIYDASGKCMAAVAIVGLFDVTARGRSGKMIDQLKFAAERISVNLGFRCNEPARRETLKAPPRRRAGA